MKDWNGYIKRMSYTINDKLFFTGQTDIHRYDAILDFGCANGELLRTLAAEYGYKGYLVGYDISSEMITSAVTLSAAYENIAFSTNLGLILEFLKDYNKILVNFSSVWHEIEVSHYDEIYNKIFPIATTITIRDMYHPQSYFDDRVQKLTDEEMKRIKEGVSENMLASYEKRWGRLHLKDWNLYHFLLKYTYVDNWDTEVEEFYFATPWEDIIVRAEDFGFLKTYDLRYTLPYKREQILKDFGFTIWGHTHRNLILTRKAR